MVVTKSGLPGLIEKLQIIVSKVIKIISNTSRRPRSPKQIHLTLEKNISVVRELAIDVVRQMNHNDIMELRLPFGLVLKAIEPSHKFAGVPRASTGSGSISL